ncbi:MAG: hypothetical protein FWC01_00995 [Treponema sp.]|nr:hypothetical protein [Treponema sp.]MCL2236751.1 hypothetical protein [Treponema sp.]
MKNNKIHALIAVFAFVLPVLTFTGCEEESSPQYSFPQRYIVYPGWVSDGDTITVNNYANLAVRSADGQTRYLRVLEKEYSAGLYTYLIYLGHIENVPMESGYTGYFYDGISPIYISRSNSTFTEDSVKSTLRTTVSVTNTTVLDTEFNVNVSFDSAGFFAGADFRNQKTTTNSNVWETQNTFETVTTFAQSSSEEFMVHIGNNGEPVGSYRLSLFATTDVYLVLQIDDDSNELSGKPEFIICARPNSYTYMLDYKPGQATSEWPRTGSGGMLPVPTDYSTLALPATTSGFVAVGNNMRAFSSDGINWELINDMENGGSLVVSFGNNQFIYSASNNSVKTSQTGLPSALNSKISSPRKFNGIYHNGTGWVCVSNDGYIYDSTDLNSWRERRITRHRYNGDGQGSTETRDVFSHWNDVTYNNGIWIVVGGYSDTYSLPGNPSYSTVNRTYNFSFVARYKEEDNNLEYLDYSVTNQIKTETLTANNISWNGIAIGENNSYIVVGSNGISRSIDGGLTWTSVNSGSWNKVGYHNGMYVTVGNALSGFGRIAYSTNGINWTTVFVGTPNWMDIAYGERKWVAVGGEGNDAFTAYSSNGINWTHRVIDGSNTPFTGIAYGKY